MILHLFEHDSQDLSNTNITAWASEKGYGINQTYVCNGEKFPSLHDFDWLMVMGGSPSLLDEEASPWLPSEKEFISQVVKSGKVIIGICFGAQLLADALGARVFLNRYREVGWYDVILTPEGKNSFLFRNIEEKFMTFHWHSDHFSLPRGCTQLAFSEATENQAFVFEDRPIIGLQFHPEYTLEMARDLSFRKGDDLVPDRFVSGKEAMLAQAEKTPETYWLMASLLDNIEREFRI